MNPSAAIRAACLGAVVLHAPLAGAQAAATPWSTACTASHCTASAKVLAREANVPYAYQLRISRFADARTELVLLTGSRRPADDASIDVQIDGRAVARLAPGVGYRRVGPSNTFRVAQGEAASVLQAMRDGKQLVLGFRTAAGSDERVPVALQGLDAALTRIGVQTRPPTGVAAAAAAQQPLDPRIDRPAAPAAGQTSQDAPTPTSPVKRAPARKTAVKRSPRSAAATASVPAPADASPPVSREAAPVSPAAPAIPPDAAELPAAALDAAPAATSSVPAPMAPRQAPESVSVPRQFACQGNEPFWNLTISGDNARFVSLTGSGDAHPVRLTGRLRATAARTGASFGWRGTDADGSAYGALIERRSCRDSMSDREGVTTFAYAATVAAPGGMTLHGCCNAGPALDSQAGAPGEPAVQLADLRARAPEDWTRHLPDMLRAVQACLDRTPGEGAYVTKAWPMNRAMVGVRTRNASVGWFECVAQQDGRAIDRFAPVDATAERVVDEERVLYVPAEVVRQEGNCFRHEQLLDDAGRPLGWLTVNACWRAPGAAPVGKRR